MRSICSIGAISGCDEARHFRDFDTCLFQLFVNGSFQLSNGRLELRRIVRQQNNFVTELNYALFGCWLQWHAMYDDEQWRRKSIRDFMYLERARSKRNMSM